MLAPQVLAPRGVYESCFYLLTIGTLVLFSVTSAGLLHRKKVVRTPEEYAKAMAELTTALDVVDPLDRLTLVD